MPEPRSVNVVRALFGGARYTVVGKDWTLERKGRSAAEASRDIARRACELGFVEMARSTIAGYSMEETTVTLVHPEGHTLAVSFTTGVRNGPWLVARVRLVGK